MRPVLQSCADQSIGSRENNVRSIASSGIRRWSAACIALAGPAVLILTGCAAPPGPDLSPRITADDARTHVAYLASDEMEGRMTASRGSRRAGRYIAQRLTDAGVAPGGDEGTYFQAFPYQGRHGRNVIAMLPPTDGGDEYVLIGAHYDHIGFGEVESHANEDERDLIHNGADDNASGVAVVLELAAAYGAERSPDKAPRRGLIFACWSGEEVGVLGSTHFAANPCVPIEQIVAYLNFDMVGHLQDDTLVVQGVGSSPGWGRWLERRNIPAGFDLRIQEDPYQPTDTIAIYPKGVPVLGFYTGTHEFYNTPADDPETLNYEGIERIASFAKSIIDSVAGDVARLAYFEMPMEKATSPDRPVSTGTIPDYASGDVPGMRISGVRKGGPAEQAGIQAGDIIVEFDGHKIGDASDYQEALAGAKPDVTVDIVVLRNGERLVLKITPVGR